MKRILTSILCVGLFGVAAQFVPHGLIVEFFNIDFANAGEHEVFKHIWEEALYPQEGVHARCGGITH